jgi:serine/threonine protein kinase
MGEHLGGGSYGNVFKARQRHSGQTVAVKIIRNLDRRMRCHRTVYEIKRGEGEIKDRLGRRALSSKAMAT